MSAPACLTKLVITHCLDQLCDDEAGPAGLRFRVLRSKLPSRRERSWRHVHRDGPGHGCRRRQFHENKQRRASKKRRDAADLEQLTGRHALRNQYPPISGTEGVCGSCETKAIDRIPDHRNSLLTDKKKADDSKIFCSGSKSPVRRWIFGSADKSFFRRNGPVCPGHRRMRGMAAQLRTTRRAYRILPTVDRR
jgi:hypothetical protein